jgi:hypothetical protein
MYVETERPDADPDILFSHLTRELSRWRNYQDQDGNTVNRASGFPDPELFRDGYALQTPTFEAVYRPWPLMLRCVDPACAKAVRFRDEKAWAQARNPALCDKCGSAREQFPYIMVHTCGDIREVWWPRPCPDHGEDFIYLNDRGTFAQSSWHCRAPGCNGRRLEGMRTPGCSCGNPGVYVGRTINQDNRFLTHTFPFVNFERQARLSLEGAAGADTVVIGRWLGLIDDYERALKDAANTIDPATLETARKLIDQMREQGTDETQLQMMMDSMVPKTGQALAETTRLVPADVIEHVGSQQRAREHTLIFAGAGDLRTWDLDKFEQAAAAVGRHGAIPVLAGARKKLTALGFSRVLVVENFPVALVAYGYSRLARNPTEVMLATFPPPKTGKAKDKVPIYVAESKTEAVFFELDAAKVLDWLAANGLYTRSAMPPSGVAADVAAKAEVLAACAHNQDVHDAVFRLEHTMAHALIRNLGERAGFNENTMAEYLMPAGMLTFGIFADTHQDFTLGALVTLVEHRLSEWLDAALDGVMSCDWDPHCGRNEGACSGCLHLAFGCNEFNGQLGRETLIGAPAEHGPDVSNIIHGFWR